MASYGRQAKSGFLWGLFGRLSLTLVTTAASVVVARLLTPLDFGIATAVSLFIQVAQRVTSLGFNSAIIRVPRLRDDHISTVFTISLGLGVLVGLALTLLSPYVGRFYQSPETAQALPIAALTFGIGSLGAAPAALLSRDLKFKQMVAVEAANGWVVAITSIALAWWGFGYWSLIHSLLLGAIFDATVKLWLAQWRPRIAVTRAAFQELLSVGSALYFKRLLDSVALYVDNVVIGRTLGLGVLGIYDKAFTSMHRAVTLVSYAGPTVSFSVLAKLQEDPDRFRHAFRRLIVGIGVTCYPTFVFLGMVAQPLFLILFGPQWSSAVPPFQVLCVAGALKSYLAYVSAAVQAKGHVWEEVWRQGVYVALIVVSVAVGSRWGLLGASIGVLVATAVTTLLMGDLMRRAAGVSWSDLLVPHRTGLTCAVLVSIGVLVTRWACRALGAAPGPWAQLTLETGAGAIGALTFLIACPFAEGRLLVRETVHEFAPNVGRRLGLSQA